MFMSLFSQKNNRKTHLENYFSKLRNGSRQKIKVKIKIFPVQCRFYFDDSAAGSGRFLPVYECFGNSLPKTRNSDGCRFIAFAILLIKSIVAADLPFSISEIYPLSTPLSRERSPWHILLYFLKNFSLFPNSSRISILVKTDSIKSKKTGGIIFIVSDMSKSFRLYLPTIDAEK